MANEASMRVMVEGPIDFTVADGTGITKGAVLSLYDPLTASGAVVAFQPFAGIAARDKVASDGRTRLAVYTRGIFDMYLSGACNIGDTLVVAPDVSTYPNFVASGGAAAFGVVGGSGGYFVVASGGVRVGKALETGTNGEQIQVFVGQF